MATLVDLFGTNLCKKTDSGVGSIATAELKQKVIGIYFSAHWCPPCRNFTPKLAEFYKKFTSARKDELEIVFASSDRTDEDFNSYYAEMPWLALPFADRDAKVLQINPLQYILLLCNILYCFTVLLCTENSNIQRPHTHLSYAYILLI